MAQVRTTEAIVAFLTGTPLLASVEYGPTPAYGASVADGAATAEHVLTLSGLEPGTTCLYRIRIGGEIVSEGHAFRTVPDAPDAPFRFVVLGDSGSGSQAQVDLAARFGAFAPDLVLHTGDAVYEFGAPSELDRGYFLPYRDLIDAIPFYVALGNHDTYWDGGLSLLGSLYLPVNDADFTERFYSFDIGVEAHFVALDTNGDLTPPSLQLDWLAADLAAHADARWHVVFFHHPPYSSGRTDIDPNLRQNLVPILEHGVDLVFSGHDHIYHRSYPMAGGTVVDAAQEPDYVDPGGPVYIVNGGGGKGLHGSTPQPFTAFTEVVFHFVVVDVAGPSLTLRAIRLDGTEMDRITLTKAP